MVTPRTTRRATWQPCTGTVMIQYTDRVRSNRRTVSMTRIGHSRSRMSAKVSCTVLKTSTSGDRRAEFNHEDDADSMAFHVEHILPKQHGGTDDSDTLCYACSECN